MPSRHVQKIDIPDSYYHVYARGASKQAIFFDTDDYNYFIGLFDRYLSKRTGKDKSGVPYPNYRHSIKLLAYCLMGNHFHLLIYQNEIGSMSRLMKSIMTSYSRYFNLKYRRSGSLYESTYKAALIDSDTYLLHISRYIHLNPRYWLRYKYSSIRYYLHDAKEEWLTTEMISRLFKDSNDYEIFLRDYETHRDVLQELKSELANY